jgi:hypothetical protein
MAVGIKVTSQIGNLITCLFLTVLGVIHTPEEYKKYLDGYVV